MAIQIMPNMGANIITNKELAALFTPLGSSVTEPNILLSKLLAANKLNDPPLCSKNAQNKMEKIINTNAASNLFLSSLLYFDIS